MTYSSMVLADSPLAYWRLGESVGATTFADASGNSRPLTNVLGTVTPGAGGLLTGDADTALDIAGGGCAYEADAAWMQATTALTVECWFVADTTAAGVRPLVTKTDRAVASGHARRAWHLMQSGSTLGAQLNTGVSTNVETFTSSGMLVAGRVYHAVLTYDGTNMRVFLNGALVITTAITGTLHPASTVPLVVGSSSDFTDFFDGRVDEVAIYGTALTPYRIAQHYAEGAADLYAQAVLADTPEAWWRFNEAAGSGIFDASGNGRSGTAAGTPARSATGGTVSGDRATDFDGSNDVVTVADAAWLKPSAMSIEAVVQTDTSGGTTGYIASKTNLGTVSAANYQFILYRASGTNNVGFICTNSSGTQVTIVSTGAELAGGGFHHVVGTFDGTTARLYVDGVEVASAALSGTLATGGTNALRLGGYTSGSPRWWDGDIDEVAYYAAALSAARVLAHYQAMLGLGGPAELGTATEGETAGSLIAIPPLATATEVDTPGSLSTFTANLGTATETDTPGWLDEAPPAVPLGTATEGEFAGSLVALTLADTSNRVGGRSRGGIGTADWSPPVVAHPGPTGQVRVSARAHGPVTMDRTQPTMAAARKSEAAHYDRLVIGGRDVTYFRGVPTPFPGFSLVEPLLYGATSITLPQVAAAYETPGVGELRWCRKWSPVEVQRVDTETGEVVATDFRGLVVGYGVAGPALTLDVAGEATGRAAMMERQVPLFPQRRDVGRMVFRAIRELGLDFKPHFGPTTGVTARTFGGQGMLEYLHQLLAMTWDRSGTRWTVMPTARGVYRMAEKDRATIHGTVYLDDTRTVANLRRDFTQEPNRVFMTGVTPEGQIVRFGAYPGLRQSPPAPYPMDDGSAFGPGTTNGDTDTGDGITVMIGRLRVTKYLDGEDASGGYDNDVARAIRDLQEDADLSVTGNMNEATWAALYDLSTTGFSLRWSRILPAAERSRVRRWRRSATGAILGRNPDYDPHTPKVDRNVDAGSGFTRDQLRDWARAERDESAEDNWVGTITFGTGALVAGEHQLGDSLSTWNLLRARDLRPGMNLWLPAFHGGITVHVSAVRVAEGDLGVVTVDVDTRARDAMEVWEVIARNRETRRSPHREWLREHRQSRTTKDTVTVWDEVGGLLGDEVQVPANTWTVFPVVAGEQGTVRSLRVRTNPNAEYVMAVFGRKINPAKLAARIGNPLTAEGSRRWERESVRDNLDERNLLLYAAGSDEQPLGYYPKTKGGEDDDGNADAAPLTGRWEDDAGFSYHTADAPVLYVAVFADRATSIPVGRIMWNQLEAGV